MIGDEEDYDAGTFIGEKMPCIADEFDWAEGCDIDREPALNVYEHEDPETGEVWYDSYCYRCAQKFSKESTHSSSIAGELGIPEGSTKVKQRVKFNLQPKQPPMKKREVMNFIAEIGYESGNYRGIKDEYSEFFGHLTKVNDKGKVIARYYPETRGTLWPMGYKCRNHPKDYRYGKVGQTGKMNDLSGQSKFTKGDKYLLIVGGEEDKAAAYQMLREHQIERKQDHFSPIAVVSPTTGESSAAKQVGANYDFCDMFDNILIGMDNDKAGKAAALKLAKVLPSDKVRIITWSLGDPNKMLQNRMGKQFIRDFYNSKEFTKSTLSTSKGMLGAAITELLVPRITLPEYMRKMQNMMGGGIRQGRVVNIIGNTSVGKSSHVNGLVYHLIFNSPEKVGIVSLEATKGDYALDMFSIHLEKNIVSYKDGDSVVEYLNSPEITERALQLEEDEFGEERFGFLDDREGGIKALEKDLERMKNQMGCRVFVIDVLTDILRGSDQDLQEDHMRFQKNFVKDGCTIINILHTRKPSKDKEGKNKPITEYDALGSSTFVQSAAINILIDRDKMSPDPIVKNTTVVSMPKCRGGETGEAGEWYYDPKTRKVYDKDVHFNTDNTGGDPEEV